MTSYEIIMILLSILSLTATMLGIIIKLLVDYINAKK